VVKPFATDISQCDSTVQELLIDVQSDDLDSAISKQLGGSKNGLCNCLRWGEMTQRIDC